MKPSDIFIFKCEKCGDCCKGYGGTFVTEEDIQAIAAYLKTDPERFVEDYCCMSGGQPVLAQQKNGYCMFWDNLCTIHLVKPKMCKQWPFIKNVLIDVNNWQIMAGICPGMRIDVSDDIIKERVRKELLKEST